MRTTRKVVLGLGLASSALLTAWLFTGERKNKTRKYLAKQTVSFKKAIKTEKPAFDDSEVHYI